MGYWEIRRGEIAVVISPISETIFINHITFSTLSFNISIDASNNIIIDYGAR